MEARDSFKKKWINPKKYNNTAYIVGGGPSLIDFDWDLIDNKNKFVVSVNRAYEKLPHSQLIYFTDPEFWHAYKEPMRAHGAWLHRGGLHVAPWHRRCKTGEPFWGNPSNQNKKWMHVVHDSIIDATDVYQWHLSEYAGFDERWGMLRHGKNSAYAVLNMLVAHFGFKRIYLLGLDMGWKEKGNKEAGTHWHDAAHHRIDPEHVYGIMYKAYTSCIPWIQKYLVRVINVNPNNTLPMFEHQTFDKAFKRNKK